MTPRFERVRLFADGADLASIEAMARRPDVAGFTTNPTLMRQAGIASYESFARSALEVVQDRPISLEVLADEADEILRQAKAIASWGTNVFVKVPVTTTNGTSLGPVMRQLSHEGVRLNITAVMTLEQVDRIVEALHGGTAAIVSVFAGRIADTGRDPIPIMVEASRRLADQQQLELLWASPREVLNIWHADQAGVDIITLTPLLLEKLELAGRDLQLFSRETVQMFFDDARAAGYTL